MDIYLQMYLGVSLEVSTSLRRHLEFERRRAMRKAVKAWKEVSSEAFRREMVSVCRHRKDQAPGR
jgi:hypothetical protein